MKFAAVFAVVAVALVASAQAAPVVKADKCTACKYIINVIDHFLDEGKTHEEIKVLVGDFCALLGAEYAEICNAVLDGEIEELIKWIETMTPQEVCTKLGICDAPKLGAVQCDVCKFAIDLVEAFITDETTDEQIEKFLNNLCIKMSFGELCEKLVDAGFEEMIKVIREKLGGEVVCKIIHLC